MEALYKIAALVIAGRLAHALSTELDRLARERSEEIVQAEKARWYRQGAKEVKDHFLALPWWKRLFNKF